MNIPLSNCCNAEVFMEDVGDPDDPIRETFCSKCKKICDFHSLDKKYA